MYMFSVPTTGSADFKTQPSSFTMATPSTQSDIKPHYPLPSYPSQAPTPFFPQAKPTIKPNKILKKEEPDNASSFTVIPKTESSPTNACYNMVPTKTELMVKPEVPSGTSCRSTTSPNPPPGWVNSYEPYMNHDSNSSSVSSMDTMGHHQQLRSHNLPVVPTPVGSHHMPAPPVYVAKSIEESRPAGQLRSPYEPGSMNSSDEVYHRPESARSYPLTNNTTINRPVPSYSTEMTGHSYEVSGHRPYDPGSTNNYERYDTAPQPCPTPRYPDYQEHDMRAYEPQHHHVMQGMMKPEHPSESESSEGPLYPR